MWAASALSGVSSDILFNYGHALTTPGEKFNDLVEATEYDCADENRGKVHYLYGFMFNLRPLDAMMFCKVTYFCENIFMPNFVTGRQKVHV